MRNLRSTILGKKKPGGIDYGEVTEQRIQRVRNTLIARINLSILRKGMRLRRMESDIPAQPEDNTGEMTDEIP